MSCEVDIVVTNYVSSGISTRVKTSQLHLLNATKRLEWLGGDTQIYTSGSTEAWKAETLGTLYSRSDGHSKDGDCQRYCQEMKSKHRSLRDLRTRLSKILQKHRGIDKDFYAAQRAQLRHLSLLIQRLGTRRNGLAPISRLPPELLCQVFAFASCTAGTYGSYPPSLAWVKVSHVCRHWMEVSRNNPWVWANIPAFVPQWTREMLKRSKSSPLRVHYEEEEAPFHRPVYAALGSALEHLDRITDLSISINSPRLNIPGIEHPAPILERFTLLLNTDPRGAPVIPMIYLFSGIAPRLRHMSLGGACFDWNSTLFQGLTSLELSNIGVEARRVLNPMQILVNLLAGMRMLKELRLRDALPRVEARGLPPIEHMSNLPSLTTLQVCDSPLSTTLEFLSRILVADGTRGILLQLEFRVGSTRDLSRPFLTDIERLCKINDHPLHSIRISKRSEYAFGLLVEGWSSVDGPIDTTSVPELSLELRLRDSDYTTVTNVLGRVFSVLPFSETLVVAVRNLDLKSAWRSVIRQFHGLHTVYLDDCPPASLLSALHVESNLTETDASVKPSFLPALRIMLFRNIFFGNRMKHLATLAKILMHRRQLADSAVIQLQFDQCRGMTEAHALVFQKVVSNVAWSENKVAESDSEEEEYDDSQSDD